MLLGELTSPDNFGGGGRDEELMVLWLLFQRMISR